MATSSRPKRNITATKRYSDDWEQPSLTKSEKGKKEVSPAGKPGEQESTKKAKQTIKESPSIKKKTTKPKKDTHEFSSYFESKRGTVQYSYHVSPGAHICIASPAAQKQKQPKKAAPRKRKGDVFDFCSDDEEAILPPKKTKLSPANAPSNPPSTTTGTNTTTGTGTGTITGTTTSKKPPNKPVTKKSSPTLKPPVKQKSPIQKLPGKTVSKKAQTSASSNKESAENTAKKQNMKKQVSIKTPPTFRHNTRSTRSQRLAVIEETAMEEPVAEEEKVVAIDDTSKEETTDQGNDENELMDTLEQENEESSQEEQERTDDTETDVEISLTETPVLKETNDGAESETAGAESKVQTKTTEVESETDKADTAEIEPEEEESKTVEMKDDSVEDETVTEVESKPTDTDISMEQDTMDTSNNEPHEDTDDHIEAITEEESNTQGNMDDNGIQCSEESVTKSAAAVTDSNDSSQDTISLSQQSLGGRGSVDGNGSADLSVSETEERKGLLKVPSVSVSSVPSLTRSSTWPKTTSTSVSTNQSLTVVRNVRQAHECLQHGENIQFRDQVEYLIDSMRPTQPLSIRCLSTLSLATECLKTDFCRQLRAHGLVYKIMMLLKDAVQYPALQVATVTLFFVISRDSIDGSNDLDRTCLELLLGLMENSYDERGNHVAGHEPEVHPPLEGKAEREYQKIRAKSRSVLEKCPPLGISDKGKESSGKREDTEEIITESPADDELTGIKPADLTVCELVCECLFNITATQSSCQWIKEDMRILGILDIIANRAIRMIEQVDNTHTTTTNTTTASSSYVFSKILRMMKLLENVTFMNKSNQTYLTLFDGSLLISRLCSCLIRLKDLVVSNSDIRCLCLDGLLGVLKVLLNFTHDHELGSFRVGEQTNILQSVLQCVFQIPDTVSGDKGFDLLILSLGLLINLVEHSAPNRDLFHNTDVEVHTDGDRKQISAIKAVTELFLFNYKKSKETTIDVPTPQNLSQRTPTSSPMKSTFSPMKGSGSPSVKRDLSVPLASRLKIHKDVKGYRSPVKAKEEPEDSEGMDWLPTEDTATDENEDDDGEDEDAENEPISDSLVFSREEFDAALTQAGQHMEDSIIASYTALLLAVLAKNSTEFASSLKADLPDHNYSVLVTVLKEFIEFMSMAGSSTNRSGLESIRKIIKHIETIQV